MTFGAGQLLQKIHANDYRYGISSLLTLDSNYLLAFKCFAYNMQSPFYEIFTNFTSYAFDGGLLLWKKYRKPLEEDPGPQILSMDHLGIGFLFCLVPLTLSIIAFICELFIFWVPKLSRYILNLLVAQAVVKAFMNFRIP